ncbi:unnamed protein product [Prunus brigantina]
MNFWWPSILWQVIPLLQPMWICLLQRNQLLAHSNKPSRRGSISLPASNQQRKNHIGLTLTRDIEVEAAIDFKKAKMEWRLVRIWVCANNPEDNCRMNRKLHRAGLICIEFLGWNDQRRIHVHIAEIQRGEAARSCSIAIAAGLSCNYG